MLATPALRQTNNFMRLCRRARSFSLLLWLYKNQKDKEIESVWAFFVWRHAIRNQQKKSK
jgi:hypothetical protein